LPITAEGDAFVLGSSCSKRAQQRALVGLPEPHGTVLTAGGQPSGICAEGRTGLDTQHRLQPIDLLPAVHLPPPYRAISRTGGQMPPTWAERQAIDRPTMPHELPYLLAPGYVPHHHMIVGDSERLFGRQPLPIRSKDRHLGHFDKSGQGASGRHVPDAQRFLPFLPWAARIPTHQQLFIRAESQSCHPSSAWVFLELPQQLSIGDSPQPNGIIIISACRYELSIRAEGRTPRRLIVHHTLQPMAPQPHPVSLPPAVAPVRPRQIRSSKVRITLTHNQQAQVLQALVLMCQECLLPAEDMARQSVFT
jgi:hypothetical protein